MQTFLPYPDFTESAKCLDRQRLGKQRVEAWQILYSSGWRSHPAVKMWRGYAASLNRYAIAICKEWIERGYRDNMLGRFKLFDGPDPHWLGDSKFHRSHQLMLFWKDHDYYKQFIPKGQEEIKYVWPRGR